MRPDLPVRLVFYLAEAGALAVPVGCGLLLAQSAFRRWGRAFPAVTWRRILALVLGLAAVDAALAEFLGPRVIVQYYAAALALAAGICAWLLSRVFATLAAGRGAL